MAIDAIVNKAHTKMKSTHNGKLFFLFITGYRF
jgi:hypothetical protein